MTDIRAVTSRTRAILLADWDPIGVAGEPAAQSEYDAYAPRIAGMVASGVSVEELARHLLSIEVEWMGLRGDAPRARQAAAKLLTLPSDSRQPAG